MAPGRNGLSENSAGGDELQRDVYKRQEFQTRNLFSEIWLLLLGELSSIEEYERPAVDLARQERLQTMLAFIWQNYQRRITLDEIAAAAHVGGRELSLIHI